MKKALSIFTALALLLTTFVVPMAVFADEDISLAVTGEEAAALSYLVYTDPETKSPVSQLRPGQNFYVDVNVDITNGDAIAGFDLSVSFDQTRFEAVEPISDSVFNSAIFTEDVKVDAVLNAKINDGEVVLVYTASGNNNKISITTDKNLTLATIPFKVLDNAAVGTDLSFGDAADKDKMAYDMDETYLTYPYELTKTSAAVEVVTNTVSVKIGDREIQDDDIFYTDVSVVVDSSAVSPAFELTKDGTIVSGWTPDTPITETGTYVLTISDIPGAAKITRTFMVDKFNGFATITTALASATVSKGGDLIVNASLSGLDKALIGASMVAFDVVYDPSVLTVSGVTGTNVTHVDNQNGSVSVVYGDEDNNDVSNAIKSGAFAQLTFKVAETAEAKGYDLTIQNFKAAKYVTYPQTADYTAEGNSPLTFTVQETQGITWTPNENWTNQALSFAVTIGDTSAQYAAASEVTGSDVKEYLLQSGKAVTNGQISVDKPGDYYVLLDGAENYVTIPASDLKFDDVAPGIEAITPPTSWTKGNYNLPALNITDEGGSAADASQLYYALGAVDAPEAVSTEIAPLGTIDLTGKSYEAITVKVLDHAGNAGMQIITIKKDNIAPEVSLTTTTTLPNASAQVTLTAADIKGNDNSGFAEGYAAQIKYASTDVGYDQAVVEGDTIAIGGTFTAAKAGFYYVKVQDQAENEAVAQIDLTQITTASTPALLAKVYNDTGAQYYEGLLPTTTLASNGTFKVMAFQTGDTAEGFTTTLKLQKEGEEEKDYMAGELIQEPGAYTLKVITENNTNSDFKAEASYAFSISQTLPSVNGDGRYNILDFAMMRAVQLNNKNKDGYFTGGYFAGDVSGNLKDDEDDLIAMLNALMHSAKPENYGTYLNIAK